MITFREYTPSPALFNSLTDSVDWGTRDEGVVQTALENSLCCVCAFDGEEIVGFGRLIGDRTIFLYVQDVMVRPEYQGQKVGTGIMEKLIEEVNEYKQINKGIRTYLGASRGKEDFYRRFGFETRADAGLGPGMVLF
ncbi:MAG: GNAT family N-acetyltransferase [Oscillospiraceae bacterium]|nr:GNAT family N-acetyltransferase [Oscillospiraceae bacterium]